WKRMEPSLNLIAADHQLVHQRYPNADIVVISITLDSSLTNHIWNEIRKYLALPLEDHIDPLLWWQMQQKEFPRLCLIARGTL
ncbi:37745_t:CDS:2, partial [Gigaspora margarita]